MSTTQTGTTGAEPASAPPLRRKLRNYLHRCRPADPLHGLHHHDGRVPHGGAGVEDLRGAQGHLEGDPGDRLGGSFHRRRAEGAVPQQRSDGALRGMVGFGLLLVLSVAAVGIWITHKVAGPLFKIAGHLRAGARQQAGAVAAPAAAQGRRAAGVLFHFRDMYEALRARADGTCRSCARHRPAGAGRRRGSAPHARALEELRRLQAEQGSEPGAVSTDR